MSGARTASIAGAIVLAAGVAWIAGAQSRGVPAPPWARSVEVVEDGAPVVDAPSAAGRRRGTVALGTRLSLADRVLGDGCATGAWARIGSGAYVCEAFVRPSPLAPFGTALPTLAGDRLLPHDYAFVTVDGTRAYAHPSDYFADQYAEALGEGFGLVVTETTLYDGVPFARTRRGRWVERDALRPIRGSDFAGVALRPGEPLDLAWVRRDGAPVQARPRSGRVLRRLDRRAVVRVRAVAGGVAELVDGGFVRSAELAIARPSDPPTEVAPGSRWIDVDVGAQVLVAYEGTTPVYATLVSTGRDAPSHATPLGVFRIWVKLAFSDMDDLEREDVSRNYAIEQIPWVQFFEGENGFHAAFWHDDFGRRRSHGCVNLSPRDARFLFDFTEPRLPDGWLAVLPLEGEPATVVRVR